MTKRQSTIARRACAFAGTLVLAVFGVAQPGAAQSVSAQPVSAQPVSATGHPAGSRSVKAYTGLTNAQRANLMGIARDTWKFFADDVDPTTHLPMDNVTYRRRVGHGHVDRAVHGCVEHRGIPVVRGLGRGPRTGLSAEGTRAHLGDAHRSQSPRPLERIPVPVV